MAERDLATLQHWMQSRIVTDALVTDALPGAAAYELRRLSAAQMIRGSGAFSAEQRLRVYVRGYVLRLIECLRSDFPVLRALVGDQVFDLFATAYLTEWHSRSYTLFDLGAGFADFLDATRPPEGAGPGTLEAIPASLARLERAMSEVSRARGPETERDYDLLAPAILLLAPGRRLRLPESVRLLRLDFDFCETLAAVERGERPTRPPARAICVAVARSHYHVTAHHLEAPRFAWLEALGHEGAEALQAVARAQERTGGEAGTLLADLIGWLPFAVQAGLIGRDSAEARDASG